MVSCSTPFCPLKAIKNNKIGIDLSRRFRRDFELDVKNFQFCRFCKKLFSNNRLEPGHEARLRVEAEKQIDLQKRQLEILLKKFALSKIAGDSESGK